MLHGSDMNRLCLNPCLTIVRLVETLETVAVAAQKEDPRGIEVQHGRSAARWSVVSTISK
jgi:hypothetical protein